MPPVSGGALVAAAPLHTPPRAIVHLPPTFWCSKASPEFWGLINYNAWNAFFLCTRPCLDELLRGSRGHQSARRGITMHFAILVGGTGPVASIPAVAMRVAHLCRATTRVRVTLPVLRGGCARRDKRIGARATAGFEFCGSSWQGQA